MQEYPRYRELESLLDEAREGLTRTWKGFAYRCVSPQWARPKDLLSGAGTFLYGSRWLRAGVANAVYAATSEAIALKESRRVLQHFGIQRPKNEPRVVVEMEVCLVRVADLNRLDRLLSWPNLEKLLAENWEGANAAERETVAQATGRALAGMGFSGLIVPSSRDRRGRNLAWYPDQLRAEEFVRISGKSELERWIAE